MEDHDPSPDSCPLPAAAAGSVVADPAAEPWHEAEEPSSTAEPRHTSEHARRTRLPAVLHSNSPKNSAASLLATELQEKLPLHVVRIAACAAEALLTNSMKAVNMIAEAAFQVQHNSKTGDGDIKVQGACAGELFQRGWDEEASRGLTKLAVQAYVAAACLQSAQAWAAIGYILENQPMVCPASVFAAYKEAAALGDVFAMYNAACVDLRSKKKMWTPAAG